MMEDDSSDDEGPVLKGMKVDSLDNFPSSDISRTTVERTRYQSIPFVRNSIS